MPILLQQKNWQNFPVYLTLLLRIPKFYNRVSIPATSGDQFSVRRQSRNTAWCFMFRVDRHTYFQLLCPSGVSHCIRNFMSVNRALKRFCLSVCLCNGSLSHANIE